MKSKAKAEGRKFSGYFDIFVGHMLGAMFVTGEERRGKESSRARCGLILGHVDVCFTCSAHTYFTMIASRAHVVPPLCCHSHKACVIFCASSSSTL
jgi:hypothetical protein